MIADPVRHILLRKPRYRLAVFGLGILLTLSGCARYTPLDPGLTAFPRAFEARRLATPPAGAWTSADLLKAGLANNPRIAEAAAKYETAVAAAAAARVRPAPTLTLTAEYAKAAGGSSPWLFGAGSDIPLDYGVRRSDRLDAANLTAMKALYDLGETIWSVRIAIERAHLERLAAEEQSEVASQLIAARETRAARLLDRVRAGTDDMAPAIIAETELGAARRVAAEAAARREQANTALAQALGVDVAVARTMTLAPVSPYPAQADLAMRREQAILARRDVLSAVADYDLAEIALQLEVARQHPDVHIGPGYTWERGVTKLPFNLSLALPPTDLNRAAIAQAEAKRAETGRSLEVAQASVMGAVDQSAAAVTAARAAEALTHDRDLPAARRMAAAAERNLAAGEGDRIDALAAQAAVWDAELNALAARSATLAAVIDLEDALRAPFDPVQNRILQDAMQSLRPAI